MVGLEQTDADTAGARLARARVRLGLTVNQVAEKLRLDAYTIVALEAGDHKVIGAVVFVRGFLRRYADLVGESSAEIESLFARRPDARTQPDLANTGMHRIEPTAHRPKLGVVPALIAAAVLAISGAIWWAMRAQPQADTVVSVESAQLMPAAAPPASTAGKLPVETTAAAAGSDASVSKPAAADAALVPNGRRRQLQLTFNGECWTEIYDARGVRLFFGFGHTGTSQDLSGVAPFRLALGNAAALALSVEGTPVVLPAGPPGVRLRVTVNGDGAVVSVR